MGMGYDVKCFTFLLKITAVIKKMFLQVDSNNSLRNQFVLKYDKSSWSI